MYLYVDKAEDLSRVPELLLKKLGKVEVAMTLLLTPERKLSRIDAQQINTEIVDKGFYLQLPPQQDSYMKAVHEKNSKM
jgi:hypothetical protein